MSTSVNALIRRCYHLPSWLILNGVALGAIKQDIWIETKMDPVIAFAEISHDALPAIRCSMLALSFHLFSVTFLCMSLAARLITGYATHTATYVLERPEFWAKVARVFHWLNICWICYYHLNLTVLLTPLQAGIVNLSCVFLLAITLPKEIYFVGESTNQSIQISSWLPSIPVRGGSLLIYTLVLGVPVWGELATMVAVNHWFVWVLAVEVAIYLAFSFSLFPSEKKQS